MIVLAVSRSAQRGTSGMIEGLAACFTGLEDLRATRRCDHRLIDILVIAVCAVIAIKNALHWVLDVTFREDDSRVRDRTAARNLVTRDRHGRASQRGRRKMAAWNDDYMLQIITGQAHA